MGESGQTKAHIAIVRKKMLQRLSKQGWAEDYDVAGPELRPLVRRLLTHVLGRDLSLWGLDYEPPILKAADLRQIAALLGRLQKLQDSMEKNKHILDPLACSLQDEHIPARQESISAALTPLLDELKSICEFALYPLRHPTRRGAPSKASQERLIRDIAIILQGILIRHRDDKHQLSKAAVAREVRDVLGLINVRVTPKRIQNLIGRPIK